MGGAASKTQRFLQHLEPLQGALEAYARRNLNDPNSVEDVLQNVLANSFRDFHLYVEGTNFRAWMFRYLHLEIFTLNRKEKKHTGERLPDDLAGGDSWEQAVNERAFECLLESPDAVLEHCDDVLAQAVRELAPLERSALLLKSIGEFKYREISEILEIPIGTVMSHLARSRTRLRYRLIEFGRQRGLLKDKT